MKNGLRKLWKLLMFVCMVMMVEPMSAKADVGWDEAYVYSYETLKSALESESITYIYVEYANEFSWPTDDVTLTVDKEIQLRMDWTIPENVTLNLEDGGMIRRSGSGYIPEDISLTMNGPCVCTGGSMKVDEVIVNGNMKVSSGGINGKVVVNGSIEREKTGAVGFGVSDMVVAKDAKLVGRFEVNGVLQLDNAEIGEEAEIVVESGCEADIKGNGTISLLTVEGTANIGAGAEVSDETVIKVNKLTVRCWNDDRTAVVNIYEELSICDRNHSLKNAVIRIAENGVLSLMPRSRFGTNESIAKIIGNGIIKGYADGDEENGSYWNYPILLGSTFGSKPRPTQLASTVRVWYEWPEIGTDNPFHDVQEDSWQYPFVLFAWNYNFMTGKGTDENGYITFDPNNTMTRAEFVQMLYSKEGKPGVTYSDVFADVPEGEWYSSAVIWANEQGIVSGGGNGLFDVSGKITREQMAAILYKYAEYKGYDVSKRKELTGFEDVDMISPWAVDRMQWALEYGAMAGSGAKLNPVNPAARAEAAAMVKSFMVAYEGIEK